MTGKRLRDIGAAVLAEAAHAKGKSLTDLEKKRVLARAAAVIQRRDWDAYARAHRPRPGRA